MGSLDKTYARYLETGAPTCSVSIADVDEADRLLGSVLRAFRMPSSLDGKSVMDLGCGLGSVAAAFQRRGATVTALDNSARAIEHIGKTYPGIEAVCAQFGPDYRAGRLYDLVWMRDFGLCSTLDWEELRRTVLEPTASLLAPGGCVLLGMRSTFSGDIDRGNWANWPYAFVERLRDELGADGPIVAQFGSLMGWVAMSIARTVHVRRVPFYMRFGAQGLRGTLS